MAPTYKIGEAAALLNLKTYVLRFWETEFPQIAPSRTEKGQRAYSEADLAALRRIRFLLHERGLTIEGARKALAQEAARGRPAPAPARERAAVSPPPEEASLAGRTFLPGHFPGHAESFPDSVPSLAATGGQAGPVPAAALPAPAEPSPHYLAQAPAGLYNEGPEARQRAEALRAFLRDAAAELEAVAALLRGDEDGSAPII